MRFWRPRRWYEREIKEYVANNIGLPLASSKRRGDVVYQPLLVSIATPSLNRGAYIEQTILSVRRQSYPRVEHIVVDGGSTDATRDILRRHEGAYEMRWVSEPDGGMYGAAPYFRYTAKGSDK